MSNDNPNIPSMTLNILPLHDVPDGTYNGVWQADIMSIADPDGRGSFTFKVDQTIRGTANVVVTKVGNTFDVSF